MARGKHKAPTKTFQQRQTESRQRDAQDRVVVEDMASKFTCSNAIARDFAEQCEERIADLDFDLICSRLALDFWSEPPEPARPLIDALRELEAERQRHFDALTRLGERLRELTGGDVAHHHLALPGTHYQQKIRDRLFPDLELTAAP
jgi:hypothetical protein